MHTVYGHIDPRAGLAPGVLIDDLDAVGTIAETSGAKSPVPPHLHLTMALIEREGAPERLDWAALRESGRVVLLDPVIIMR